MKRIISVLLTITMLLGITVSVPLSVSAVATDKVENGYYEKIYEDEYGEWILDWSYEWVDINNNDYYVKGYKIVSYNGSMADVRTPSSFYDSLPVVEIGERAFSGCTNLNSIKVSSWITTIGAYAFSGCSNLTSITLEDGITSIGAGAFEGCNSLTDIYYVGSESEWNSILIYGGDSFKNVNIHYNYGEVISGDFNSGMYSDRHGKWEYKLRDDGKGYMITGHWSLNGNKNIEIPRTINNLLVLEIADNAFKENSYIRSITIPSNIEIIGDNAFYCCTNLESVIISYGVMTIGDNAFYCCTNLESVIILHGVMTIGEKAFYNCKKLTNITMQNTITTIENSAFNHCNSLTNITIPDSVTFIGEEVFSNCDNLVSIEVSPYNSDYVSVDGILFDKACSKLIAYPEGKTADTYIVPDTVTTINKYAFRNSKLINIIIPNSVTDVGRYAFYMCRNLTDITISNSVTNIEEYSFYECHSLTSITIPESVTNIGNCAFYKCSNLTNITMPNSVTKIGQDAFYSCSSLTDVYYTGSESEWNNISIASYNKPLTNATIHYAKVQGDISGDGELAVDDVIYLLKNIVGDTDLTAEQLALADVSGDGKLTVLDALLIQRLILETA